MKRILRWVFGICCGAYCATVYAGSPWWVDNPGWLNTQGSGTPYTWPGGQIVYVTDTGGLAPFSQTEIAQKVKEAFTVWAGAGLYQSGALGSKPIPTVNLLPSLGGETGQKLTLKNLDAYAKKGPVIIFDTDGAMIESLFKVDGVRAVTIIDEKDLNPQTLRLLRGKTILNGAYLKDQKEKDPQKNPVVGAFFAALIHEIGHLLNLDHSGLNAAQFTEINVNLGTQAEALPTMYPIVLERYEQATLHVDDIVAISTLYPRPELTAQFCTIAGTLLGSDGLGFQGAQVIARNVQDQMTVAVSAITGNAFPQGAADGSYILRGILPGKLYGVTWEELPPEFVGFSSIQPYGDNDGELPRSGFGSGLITAGSGKAKTVQCVKAGDTILMDTVQFAIPSGATWQPQVQLVPAQPPPTQTADGKKPPQTSEAVPASSGGGCSLLR